MENKKDPEISRRHIGLLLALVLFALSASGCASSQTGLTSRSEPSPALGVALAVFPGILVHGLGHRYAGDRRKANELLEQEAYGVLFLSIGGGLTFLGISSLERGQDSSGGAAAFHKVSGGLALTGAVITGAIGIFLFFDSWLTDIVQTPAACRRAAELGGFDEVDDGFYESIFERGLKEARKS